MFNAVIERGTGVRRVHITEEAQMKENVYVDCKHYESCKKPERYMKCMGYEEKERQQAAGADPVEGGSRGSWACCAHTQIDM